MTKLSDLTRVTTAGNDTLFYLVDPSRSAGDQSVGMDKDDVQNLLDFSVTMTNALNPLFTYIHPTTNINYVGIDTSGEVSVTEESYLTTQDMLDDEPNQTQNSKYFVWNLGFWKVYQLDVSVPQNGLADYTLIASYSENGNITVNWNEIIGSQNDVNVSGFTNDAGYITSVPSVNWDEITGDQNDVEVSGFTNDAGYITNVPPVNWNEITGNQNAVAISGFDIDLDVSAFDNDAGYITNADGGDAATLDGLDSLQFLRSDVDDVFSGNLTLRTIDASTKNLKIETTNSSNQANIDFVSTGGTGLFQLDQSGNMVFRNNNNDIYFDANNANGDIFFRTGGLNTRVRIQSNGNFGIATTNPTEKLEVNGNVLADRYKSDSDISTSSLTINTTNFTLDESNYTLSNNRLIVIIFATSKTGVTGTQTIATLPIAARPNRLRNFTYYENGAVKRGDVSSNGDINLYNTSPSTLYEIDFEMTLDLTQI